MSFFSSKKKELEPKLIETPEQSSAKGLLSSYWQKYGANYNPTDVTSPYQPYSRELSAGMPTSYAQIDPLISSYLNQGQNQLLGAGSAEILKTLQGGYDPYTSEYYKSFKRGVGQDVAEAQAALRQKAQAGGMYESLGRLLSEADVEGQGQDRLNAQLAAMQQQERQNMLNVLPYAQSYGQYEAETPTRQLSTIANYGGIKSGYEQADLDRLYQEWLRQKTEQKYPMEVAQQFLSSYQPTMAYPQYSRSPSTFSQILGGAGDIASIMNLLGWGQGKTKT